MINKTWSLAIVLFGLASQIDAIETENSSQAVQKQPSFKPNYNWMTPQAMTSKPRNYWQFMSEDVVKSPFEYGNAEASEKQVEYGQWENTLRLDASDFYDVVMRDDDHLWVVTFMDPKCENCSKFVPEWVKLKQHDHL